MKKKKNICVYILHCLLPVITWARTQSHDLLLAIDKQKRNKTRFLFFCLFSRPAQSLWFVYGWWVIYRHFSMPTFLDAVCCISIAASASAFATEIVSVSVLSFSTCHEIWNNFISLSVGLCGWKNRLGWGRSQAQKNSLAR